MQCKARKTTYINDNQQGRATPNIGPSKALFVDATKAQRSLQVLQEIISLVTLMSSSSGLVSRPTPVRMFTDDCSKLTPSFSTAGDLRQMHGWKLEEAATRTLNEAAESYSSAGNQYSHAVALGCADKSKHW